jgi:hypothetical protein
LAVKFDAWAAGAPNACSARAVHAARLMVILNIGLSRKSPIGISLLDRSNCAVA